MLENYDRKQTLANAERFITPELKEYEVKVLSASDKIIALEYELFLKLKEDVAKVLEDSGRLECVEFADNIELGVVEGNPFAKEGLK